MPYLTKESVEVVVARKPWVDGKSMVQRGPLNSDDVLFALFVAMGVVPGERLKITIERALPTPEHDLLRTCRM